jgi:hypothetical protein
VAESTLKKLEKLIYEGFKDTDKKIQETDRQIQATSREFERTQRKMDERFAKTDERFAKTDERFAKMDKQTEETRAEIRELSKEIKAAKALFTGQWGKLMEALAEGDLINIFTKRGMNVRNIYPNVPARKNGFHAEADFIVDNTDTVILVEVKTTLRVEHVNELLELIKKFDEYFPRFVSPNIHGGVVALKIDEEADRYAYKKGLYVMKMRGHRLLDMLNDENFRPVNFAK